MKIVCLSSFVAWVMVASACVASTEQTAPVQPACSNCLQDNSQSTLPVATGEVRSGSEHAQSPITGESRRTEFLPPTASMVICPSPISMLDSSSPPLQLGVDLQASRAQFLELAHQAPTLAMALLLLAVEDYRVPDQDQRYHYSLMPFLPSDAFVRAAFDGKEESTLRLLSGEWLPSEALLMLESRAAVQIDESVELRLSARTVTGADHSTIAPLQQAVIRLERSSHDPLPVQYSTTLFGMAYRIASFKVAAAPAMANADEH